MLRRILERHPPFEDRLQRRKLRLRKQRPLRDEAGIAQHRRDLRITRDNPGAAGLVVIERRLRAELAIERIGIGGEDLQRHVEDLVQRRRRHLDGWLGRHLALPAAGPRVPEAVYSWRPYAAAVSLERSELNLFIRGCH